MPIVTPARRCKILRWPGGCARNPKGRRAAMTHRLTRRALLASAGTGAALAALPVRAPAQATTNLDFVVWNYSLETIQDNIKKFEGANPDVDVRLTDYTWPDYFDT